MKVSMVITDQDWDEFGRFVNNSPKSSFYHTVEWKKILEASFGHKARFLVVRSDSNIIDALPLYLVSIMGFRKKLVCIPMSGSYSTFLSENDTAQSLLLEAAIALAQKEKVQYLEIRSNLENKNLIQHNFIERNPFYFSQIAIQDLETNRKLLSEGHRKSIAKAKKLGVSIEPSEDRDDLKKLYAVMEEMYREFGTPIFDYSYLENMWEQLKPLGLFVMLVIKHAGRIIGGGCFLLSRDTLIYKYGTYLPSERALCPFPPLHWSGIEECVKRGLHFADLGASSAGDKGLLQFKKNWGASETPGYFYYLPIKGKPPQMDNYLDSFQFVKKLWKRFPKPLLRMAGPYFYRWVC